MLRTASTFSTTLTQTVYDSALEEVSVLHIFCHFPAPITPLQAWLCLQCELTELHVKYNYTVQRSIYFPFTCALSPPIQGVVPIHPMKCLQSDVVRDNLLCI